MMILYALPNILVFLLSCTVRLCSSITTPVDSLKKSPPIATNIPWWENSSTSTGDDDLVYTPVSDNFDWDNRRTGVSENWINGLAVWSHYNSDGLSAVSNNNKAEDNNNEVINNNNNNKDDDDDTTDAVQNHHYRRQSTKYPIPWTTGRMLKSLRAVNHTAFELCSLYEEKACGIGFRSFMKDRRHNTHPNVDDKLLQHEHTFLQTPNRVTNNPKTHLPPPPRRRCDDNIDDVITGSSSDKYNKLAGSSQVTIVQKDSATFAGGRWLSSSEHAKECLRVTNVKEATTSTNESEVSADDNNNYRYMQIYEMWLSEKVPSNNNDRLSSAKEDGRKVGLFCIYNGLSGKLVQFFRMNEVLLFEGKSGIDPKTNTVDLDDLEKLLCSTKNIAWTDSATNLLTKDVHASVSSSSSSSIEEVLSTRGYTNVVGRAVKNVDIMSGESIATELLPPSSSSSCTERNTARPSYYFPPSSLNHVEEDYFRCQFEDGVYMCIPKRFHPDMEMIGLELGCFKLNGDFHRVLAVGDRKQGKFHTTVYELWSK